MKKLQNIIAWVSFAVIGLVIMLADIFAGAMACNWLSGLLGIQGSWWAFTLTPVLFAVALSVNYFLFSGIIKYGELRNENIHHVSIA